MNYREKVRNGNLYLSFNTLLRTRLPQIKEALTKELRPYLNEKQFTTPLDLICSLENHRWEQCTQWRIEIDFDKYEWSIAIMKPHAVGALIMLEEVAGKKTLHFSYLIYTTFALKPSISEAEKINETQLFNADFIELKRQEVESLLEKLPSQLMLEIKQIPLDQLELMEDK